jgi:hypothetical protein
MHYTVFMISVPTYVSAFLCHLQGCRRKFTIQRTVKFSDGNLQELRIVKVNPMH